MERHGTEPVLVQRPEVPYVAVREQVTMATLAGLGRRFAEVFAWVDAHSLAAAGPPFFRYRVIDMERELLVEAGVPLFEAVTQTDGDIVPGVLPAGTYAVTTHVGHPEELVQVTADLLASGEAHGWEWDRWSTPEGDAWGCRLELMLTDPRLEPDMGRWETQLAFRVVDDTVRDRVHDTPETGVGRPGSA